MSTIVKITEDTKIIPKGDDKQSDNNPCKKKRYLSKIDIDTQHTPVIDRTLHAVMSKIFGISPNSLAVAYFDWLVHLATAPGKQAELLKSAEEKAVLFINYMIHQANNPDEKLECCVKPLPQDRRFKDEGWQNWPYNLYEQSFLLTEQWWSEATGSVRGVTQHHSEVMPFITRQIVDMFSPLNFPVTNPKVVQVTKETNGINFVKGAENFFEDLNHLITKTPNKDTEKYKVGKNIACTKGKVIYQNRLIELIQYEATTKEVYAEPILIVPAWIMKYYILDLSPENSLVKYLVEQGHTVFIISWKNPDAEDRNLGFEDYLNLGVMDAIEVISSAIPNQKIHTAGYCLGGTLLSIAAASMARDGDKRLKSMTLFASQIDFEEAGELLLFIDESQLTFLEDTMWEQGYLDKQQMIGMFQMLRSQDLIWSRIVESYMLGSRNGLNDLMAWNADATRMPYRMHSEYLRSLFLNNDLSAGRFTVAGEPITLTDIQIPIFAVSTERDHVAPWHSVYKINHFTNTDVMFLLTSGGHNAGIISEPGHKHRSYQVADIKKSDKYITPEIWQQQTVKQKGSWWPQWCKWLGDKSGSKTKPQKMGKAISSAPGEYVMEK